MRYEVIDEAGECPVCEVGLDEGKCPECGTRWWLEDDELGLVAHFTVSLVTAQLRREFAA